MYRSDSQPIVVNVEPPAPKRASWTVAPRALPSGDTRPASRPQRPAQRGWIETGLYVVTLPMTLTVGIMLAPVIWMFGRRR